MDTPTFDPRPTPTPVRSLSFVDVNGQWWIAPLGTDDPELGKPMPPAWTPVTIERRTDMI